MTPPREVIARAIYAAYTGWGAEGGIPPWSERAADAVIAALSTPEAVERVRCELPRTMMDAHDRDKYARACVLALLHGGDADDDE